MNTVVLVDTADWWRFIRRSEIWQMANGCLEHDTTRQSQCGTV